jgi:hypothetical protein
MNFDNIIFDDIGFNLDDEFVKKKRKINKTSDKFKDKAKKFLHEICIFNTKYIKKSTFEYIENRGIIPIPEKNEQKRIRTQMQLNLLTIILKIIEKFHEIKELTITTYTLNREALMTLIELNKNGKIEKINLYITEAYSFRDPKYYKEIKAVCIENKINLVFAALHLKITLIETESNFFVLEGSMNYSTNNLAEQLLFENNENSYKKDYKFIKNVIGNKNNNAVDIIFFK